MGLPTGLNGLDIPPKSRFVLACPNCGRQFTIVSLGKEGKRVSMNCPFCSFKLGVARINKLIAAAKKKKEAKTQTVLKKTAATSK